MDPLSFTFWLQGFFELADPKALTEAQTKVVREHLALVFEHVAGEPSARIEPVQVTLPDISDKEALENIKRELERAVQEGTAPAAPKVNREPSPRPSIWQGHGPRVYC